MSSPKCRTENGIQPLTHFDKVSSHYPQIPEEQLEENLELQHPDPLKALHQLADLGFPLNKLRDRLRSGLSFKQKVVELETRQKTLENIVSVLSRELDRREEVPGDRLGEAMARILCLEEKVEQQDALLALKDMMISNLAARVHTLEQTTYDGHFLWKVPEVGFRTREAQIGNRPALYSPWFYTSRYGYKLSLKLFLNGDGTGAGTHLSLFLVLMKGEHDFQLKWPFRHKVTFTLLDQVNKQHISTSFRPLESSSSFQRPVKEVNVASGLPEFCPLNVLHAQGANYICNDTLAIQAVIDMKV
ncbi:TNF receptor-associated factor 2-like [Hemicordylus capensis]|uniref:TNF receptor-associated factor 2-like n=1 Tax=Hemicordylus capensis TaxID=884348 RepID=UPI0023038EF7|nr:TNF receptor-associated factor 2-like [Hemicordylus capensis]